jgi:aspartate/methionine/tyrosine aminotransferase
MQIWGIAKNHDYKLNTFHLREDRGWAPDIAELESVLTASTKLIAVCNPNNPTGRILTESEMDAIVASADRVGAWILSDEVYRGANRVSDVELEKL